MVLSSNITKGNKVISEEAIDQLAQSQEELKNWYRSGKKALACNWEARRELQSAMKDPGTEPSRRVATCKLEAGRELQSAMKDPGTEPSQELQPVNKKLERNYSLPREDPSTTGLGSDTETRDLTRGIRTPYPRG
jgi:hypothetical protein